MVIQQRAARAVGFIGRGLFGPAARARLRRSRAVDRLLRVAFSGVRTRPHPHAAGYSLCFDGYRNIGWTFGGLAGAECDGIAFAARELTRLRPACVWDVGANVGFWSVYLASVRPAIDTVVCFEPDPVNRGLLERGRAANRIGSMVIRPVCLSDRAGPASFQPDPTTGASGTLESGLTLAAQLFGGPATARVPVEASTADAEVASGAAPPPQFVKVDVEGHELAVLRGATRTLREHRPTLLIEVTRDEDAVGALLRDAGYRLVNPLDGSPMARPAFATAAVPA